MDDRPTDPRAPDPRALAARAMQALRSGDAKGARDLFMQTLDATPRDLGLWLNLAIAERGLNDDEAEFKALEAALALDPRSLVGLLLKAAWYERRGETRKAGSAFGAVLQVAPPFDKLPPDLRAPVRHAADMAQAYGREREGFLRDFVKATADRAAGERLDRFEECLDVTLGKKAIYRQQPHILFWPGLPTIQFFDRELFPWMDGLDAATDDIRGELLQVLGADQDLVPYIDYPDSAPLDQWRELNKSPSWSAYHLKKDGERIEEHCEKCPKTMAALEPVPGPDLPKHCPVAMFSILKPRTRIPPHTGVTNARLVVHLPLIVPEKCLYRVGNDSRPWIEGKAWVFDDTIEHEARNDSDKVRVLLICDVWNPFVREAEKPLIGALIQGLDAFADEAASRDW
jgi:aspartate beta-hydroxylase